MLMNDKQHYGLISKLLHWLIALAIFVLLAVGAYMTGLDKQDPGRADIYATHKAVGTLVLLLVLFRVVWNRLISRTPELPDALEGMERLLPKVVTSLLYLLMLATPIFGITMSQLYGQPVNIFDFYQLPAFLAENKDAGSIVKELHGISAWSMLALIVLHVLGAAKHRIKDRGGEKDILDRML
jgi:cytochrome b561